MCRMPTARRSLNMASTSYRHMMLEDHKCQLICVQDKRDLLTAMSIDQKILFFDIR